MGKATVLILEHPVQWAQNRCPRYSVLIKKVPRADSDTNRYISRLIWRGIATKLLFFGLPKKLLNKNIFWDIFRLDNPPCQKTMTSGKPGLINACKWTPYICSQLQLLFKSNQASGLEICILIPKQLPT
jgi:hypothetical protein